MRRAARVDETQPAIVQALRSIGAGVRYIKEPLDLVVAWRGATCLVECKSPGGKLKPTQKAFIATWPGKVHVVETPMEAVAAVTGGLV